MLTYFIDARGRIGKLLTRTPPIRCEYAYGVGQYPRDSEKLRVLSESEFIAMMDQQRSEMWERVLMLQQRPFVKRAIPGDYVLDALCYAAVTWCDQRLPLAKYAARVLKHAGLKRKQDSLAYEELEETAAKSNCPGLEARDELYSLGLANHELDLLLSRFDAGETLADIADQLGVKSKYTVQYRIDKIIAACREQYAKRVPEPS